MPMATIIGAPTGVSWPRHDVRHPGRDVLVASRTYVVLLGGGTTNVPHEEWLPMGPVRTGNGLGAEEGASIAR